MLLPVFSRLHDIVGNMILYLDTDVLVSGLRSKVGASPVLLQAVAAEEVTPLVSVGSVLEHEAVLKRPAILPAICLTDADVDDFLDDFIAHAREVETDFRYRPLVRDPGDEMFMELAINGQVRRWFRSTWRIFGRWTGRVRTFRSVDRERFCGGLHGDRQ